MAEGGGVQTEVARDQVLGLLSGELLGYAGRAFGVDTLRVERGSEADAASWDPSVVASSTNPATRLTVAKNLGRNVEVVVSQNLRESGRMTWIAIFKPTSSIEVRGVSDDDTNRSIEFRHGLTFGGGAKPRVSPAGRQARTDARRVATVRFTGQPGFSETELVPLLKVTQGDRFDVFEWQSDRDRLQRFYATRGFLEVRLSARRQDAVGPSGEPAVALDYRIERGPQTDVSVVGYAASPATMQQIRDTWAKAVFDGFLLDDLRSLMQRRLVADGYLQAQVEPTVERREAPGQPAQKRIVLRVDRGALSTTRSISFRGNDRFSQAELAAFLRQQDLDITAWLDPESLQPPIEELYREAGFLVAAVRPETPVFAGSSATLPVNIEEGPLFLVSEVRIEGAGRRPEAGVRAAFGLRPAEPFYPSLLEVGRQRVEADYHRNGFDAVRVTAATVIDRADGSVAVTLTVDEGRRQVLSEVVVAGAGHTRSDTISRALALEPGTPVDSTGWYRARKRVLDTGLFRAADIEAEVLAEAETPGGAAADQAVRARVTVQEWPRFSFRYGLKVTDEAAPVDPSRPFTPGLLLEFQDHSLFGRAATAGVTARYERDSRIARAFFSSPRFFGLPLMSNLFLARSRQQFNSEGALPFVTDRTDVTAEQRFRPRRLAAISYSYRFEKNHTFDPHRDPDDPFALDLAVNVARLNGTILLDTRDDRLDAHRGWFHSSSLEYAVPRLGSDLRFVKYLAQQVPTSGRSDRWSSRGAAGSALRTASSRS